MSRRSIRKYKAVPVLAFIANSSYYDLSAVDCGLLAENMILSAWSMGVGSVCLGSPVRFLDGDESIRQHPQIKEVMKKLDFSESYRMILCVGFGYPDESPEAKDRDSSKYRFVEF